MNFNKLSPTASNSAVFVALLMVYVVWGTTYLALKISVVSMPPLLMNGTRFLLAGAVMFAWALWRGEALPTGQQWRNAGIVGGLMTFVAMSLIVTGQKLGIGSGLTATVVTTMPMWLALWTRMGGEKVPVTSWLGLALGVSGAALLAMEGDFSATVLGGACVFAAPFCWSLGSYASRKLSLPSPSMASAAQWMLGGLMGTAAGLAFENPAQMLQASAAAWWSWLYLVFFGTMIALGSYLWLLRNVSPALAGSYAFVNPAVALLVGVAFGNERFTGSLYLALPLIFCALGLILYGPALKARWSCVK